MSSSLLLVFMKEIFISHISEESCFALALKNIINESYPGVCQAFVSTSISDIYGGTRWMEKLEQKLDSADLLIVICSTRSLSRHWISIESGYAWARNIPIVPICFCGIRKSKLPSPFNMFQGLDLSVDSVNFISSLFESIELNLELRKIHSSEYLEFCTQRIKISLQKLKYYDLFISTPMSAFDDDESYQKFRKDILMPVISNLILKEPEIRIYCVAKDKLCLEDFDLEQDSTDQDLNALRNSKNLALIYPKKVPSSCLVEVGFALALEIRSIYFSYEIDELPFMLRKAAEVCSHVKSYGYKSERDLLRILSKIKFQTI